MKKNPESQGITGNEGDTLRPHYDFSAGRRGITAARYAQGSNLVLVDPDVADVFPDGASVNEALKALAVVIRAQGRRRGGER